ncbi:Ca2+-modulated nonselective cation channel polycystin [Teratosphaeria destructans]|uniref:Ca2+-modulated nonselective cation channel polycystin n=1 Tax=Teratosphaeria destructans TaxID=418781 RepID=A0A9W7SZF6_9PEZI|nr:Ca2+-modulated nonselective cation channel polycystin [Teratosphaeria destructans]
MTSATSSDINGAQRRIPKLGVRRKLADDSPSYPSTPSPSQSDSGGDERSTLSSYASSLHTDRSGPVHGQSENGRRVSASIKKRGVGMLGFLTMKEPSTSAWEEYAEAQNKIAAERGGRAIGMPGVSSRELPAHVPKTNSKWDGLPHTAHGRDRDLKQKRQFQTSLSAGHAGGYISGSSNDEQPSIRARIGSLTHNSKAESRLSIIAGGSSLAPEAISPAVRPAFPDDAVASRAEPSSPQQRRNTAIAPWDEPPLQQGKRNIAVAPWDEPPAAAENLHLPPQLL